MPQHTLYRVADEESEEKFLSDDDGYAFVEAVDASTVTLEELADFCDGNAESRNNHDFVGTHRILAAFLHRSLGRDTATMLMLDIARYGGLDAMNGVGGTDSAFADFGIQDCWHDWKLEERPA